MRTKFRTIIPILIAVITAISVIPAYAEVIPRESLPENTPQAAVDTAEVLIGATLAKVEYGMGYADAETNPTVAEKSNAYYQTEGQNTDTDKTEKVCEYIGNINTKKFHYPECSSVGQMKKNKVYLNCTRDEAIADGYDPCGRCCP